MCQSFLNRHFRSDILEQSQRSRMYRLSSPRSQNGVSAQTGFFFQRIERNLMQTLSHSLLRRARVLLVPNKRRQQSADIFRLLPTALGLFADQMKPTSCDRIASKQSVTVRLAWRAVRREALVFGMLQVLGVDHIECLYQHQRGRWIEGVRSSVMDVDVRHPLPS